MRKRLLALALLALVMMAGYHHYQRSRARLTVSRVLTQVERQILELQRRGQLSQPQLLANIELLKRIEHLDPSEPAIPMQIGSHYLLLQRPSAAVRWYEKALELEPRPETLANLSLAYRMANDMGVANDYLRKAKILDPRRFANVEPATEVAKHELPGAHEASSE